MLLTYFSHLYLITVVVLNHASLAHAGEDSDGWVDAIVPEYNVDHDDAYVCIRVKTPEEASRLVQVQPKADMTVVHHMLLFGCADVADHGDVWECMGHGICENAVPYFLYGWGRNAPALQVPDGVGFAVGPGSGINHLILQVHYLTQRPSDDASGVRLQFLQAPTNMSAGLIGFAPFFTIPPGHEDYEVSVSCCYRGYEPLHTFAFRVHTHWMGRSVQMSRYYNDSVTEQVLQNDPQLPQGFYPTGNHTLFPGDKLTTTCHYDSRNESQVVVAGPTHSNEMCNLYLMSYSQRPVFMDCIGNELPEQYNKAAPAVQDVHVQAGGVTLESKLAEQDKRIFDTPPSVKEGIMDIWEEKPLQLGQVSGVALGLNNTLWAFHRANRTWDRNSFRDDNHFREQEAIQRQTILQMDLDTGKVLQSFGASLLFMPHMITVNRDGSFWITDVGLHQAYRFHPTQHNILMELGRAMEPGDGPDHFCKPTQAVEDRSGNVYVADGYCNSRVVQYTADGKFVKEFKTPEDKQPMNVPHSLVIDDCLDVLLVADRENMKVHKFKMSSGEYQSTINFEGSGYPYALTTGPYGTVFVLLWRREISDTASVAVIEPCA